MAINIESESVVSLSEATRIIPPRNGKRVAISTMWRWCRNPQIDSPVKMDVKLVEADQVEAPHQLAVGGGQLAVGRENDGVVEDSFGNRIAYYMFKRHPGDQSVSWDGSRNFVRVPASSMIHYYRVDRPGQNRGVPEITPALPLFAQLRRYTLAVIAAAETAADFAAVLYTDAPANGEADEVEPMDLVELERRMATVLPGGWKLGQVAAEQPATTYGEFKQQILNEIARCLNMPFNVAAGNSSGYNYASGRLDHQTYYKSIRVEQNHMEAVVLDAIFKAWMKEMRLERLLPPSLHVTGDSLPHQWFWDGHEHVDPAKEANAQATRLASHTTTLAYEYARQGRDWEAELRQRGKEAALLKELGLTESQATPASKEPQENEDESDDDTKQRAA